MSRVVVIGAGLGGLATAVWLADFGHDVTVYEQLSGIGGRLRTTHISGHAIDLAPSPITLPAVLRDLFRKTGRPLEKVVDLTPAAPAFRYVLPGGTIVDLPNASRAGTARALDAALGTGAGAAWQHVVDVGGRVWAAARPAYLTATSTGRKRVPRQVRRAIGLDESVREFGRRLLPDPLAAILEHRCTGVDPRAAPAGLACAIAYLHQTFGRWHVAGGTAALVAALEQRARERGVTIMCESGVARVAVTKERVTGVELASGEQAGADIVVSAVDTAHLFGRLLPARLVRTPPPEPSSGQFGISLGLTHRTDLPRHTVLLPTTTDDSIHDSPARLPDHPTIDVHTSADRERVTITAAVPPHGPDASGSDRSIDWAPAHVAADFAERLLDVLAEGGIDIRSNVAWQHLRTPADTERETKAAGGGHYGSAITTIGDALARSNRTKIDGLFLVGSSAYPGPGLPLVGLSAAMVADVIGRA